MMHCQLCPSCWIKVEPLLTRAALDEREHLLMIARKIRLCRQPLCKLAAEGLKRKANGTGFAEDLGNAVEELKRWVR